MLSKHLQIGMLFYTTLIAAASIYTLVSLLCVPIDAGTQLTSLTRSNLWNSHPSL